MMILFYLFWYSKNYSNFPPLLVNLSIESFGLVFVSEDTYSEKTSSFVEIFNYSSFIEEYGDLLYG
jgi:hypothetical protein